VLTYFILASVNLAKEIESRCILCEKECSKIFHASFRGKTICGECITGLKELFRIKKGMELVSLREIRLTKELEKAKTAIHRKRITLNEKRDTDARTRCIFEQEIFPLLKPVRHTVIAKKPSHDKLIGIMITILPLIYKEVFRSMPNSKIERKAKEIVGKREADIVLLKNERPFKIIEIETHLPTDPFLREIREKSLKKEIAHFISVVGTKNLIVVSYDKDNRIASICSSAEVRYLSLHRFLTKIANFVEYYEKLGSLWSRWKLLNLK